MATFRLSRMMLLAAAVAAGCDQAPAADPVDEALLTRDSALSLFRAGLDPVHSLAGGAPTRDALVKRFVRALEARDTADLRRMVLTPAEFAWLYYPTTPQSLPPYDLRPGLLWFMQEGRSRQGLSHLLEQLGGRGLAFAGYRCEGEASREGQNVLWGPCLVRTLPAAGDTLETRLFGLIIEREGTFKFVSYANKLD